MEYKELIKMSENLRENEKKLEESLEGFKQALEVAEGISQIREAKAQIGLTYWHMKDFDSARQTFEELLTLGEKENDGGAKALAYRNLSRPEITSDGEKQVDYAKKAFEVAEASGNADLVWYAHGVVDAAFRSGLLDQATEWLQREEQELNKLLSGEVQVDNSNHVVQIWHTGYLMDKGMIEKNPQILEEALKIAQEASLPLRVEQIQALMQDIK